MTGQRTPRAATVIGQAAIDAYADISGDHNPIHVDPDFARSGEFGRTIVHGQYLLVLLAAQLEAEWGSRWNVAGELDVKFVRPAFVDTPIELWVVASSSDEHEAEAAVEITSGEQTLVVGTARCHFGGAE